MDDRNQSTSKRGTPSLASQFEAPSFTGDTIGHGEPPLAQRVVQGGVSVALASYGAIVFGFIANLFLTRLLAPEDFGIFSLATFFFALLNLRPKLGIDAAFAQRVTTDGAMVGTHLATGTATAVASLMLTLLAVPILTGLGQAPTVVWITLALATVGISDAIMTTASILLDKNLLFGRSSIVIILAFPLAYLPAFYLATHGGGAWSLVAQNATYSLLLLIGMWIACRRYLSSLWQSRWSFNRLLLQEFLRFGLAVGATTIGGTILFQYDNFLVGTFVSVATLGFYDRAYRIAQWPHLLISSVLARTAFYAYAQLKDDAARLAKTVSMSIWLVTRLALPLALAVFLAAPDLIVLLFGERWLPSAFYLRLLIVFSVLRPLLDDGGVLFVATAKPQRQTAVIFLQAMTLIAAGTPFTLAWGVVGTAVGVGIAFAVGLIATYYFVRRTVTFSLWGAFAAPAVALVATLGSYYISTQLWDWNSLLLIARVALKFAFGGIVYLGVVTALEPRATMERSRYVWKLLTAKAL